MGTGKYQITLWVALEEELAIMQLFHGKGWPYIKFRNDADKGLFTAPEKSAEGVISSVAHTSSINSSAQTSIVDSQLNGYAYSQNDQSHEHTIILENEQDLNFIIDHNQVVEDVETMESKTTQDEGVKVTYILEDDNIYCVNYTGDQLNEGEVTNEGLEFIAEGREIVSEERGINTEGREIITEGTEIITEGREFITEGREIITEGIEILTEQSEITGGEIVAVEAAHIEDESPVYIAVKKDLGLDIPSANDLPVKDHHGRDELQSYPSNLDAVYQLATNLKTLQNPELNRIILKGKSLLSGLVEQEKENKNNTSETHRPIRRNKKQLTNPKLKSKSIRLAAPEDPGNISKGSLAITKDVDGLSMRICCMCSEVYSDPKSFEEHAEVCLKELISRVDSTLFRCKTCQTGFKHASTLLRHRLSQVCQPGTIQRTGESLACKHCGKLFRSERLTDYTIHLLKHRTERAHVCDLCGKTFLRANTLRDHKRTHTGERPFLCRHCPLAFTSAAGRVNHEKTNHLPVPKRCVCDQCGASFKFSKGLDCHIREVHNAEYKYKCEHCDVTFKRIGTLNRHKKRHSDTKDKVCNVCGKAFHLQSDLNLHAKRHRNERTLFCKECNKGFYTKQTLNNHILTHTGEKPYECSECSYKCINRGNLNKHMRIRHPELTQTVSIMSSVHV